MKLRGTTALPLFLGLTAAGVSAAAAARGWMPEWSVGEVARSAHVWLRETPWLYWCLAYGVLAALIATVAVPLGLRDLARFERFWHSRTVFVLLTCATVLLIRFPTFAHLDLDPDESEDLAVALALREDPRYWVSAEGGTHGPLVEFALLPVQLAGMQLEFGSARLVELALLLGSLFFLFGTVRAFFPEAISRAAVTPATIAIAFVTNLPLVVYNAYYPAMFLGCAGAFGCARLAAGSARGVFLRALATGLALGLVPFVKLQAVPIGLMLAGVALLCVLVRCRGQGRKQRTAVLFLCAGGLAPAALVGAYLWSHDLFPHFWASYIGSNFGYASNGEMSTYGKFLFFLEWAPDKLNGLFLPYFLYTIAIGVFVLGLEERLGRCWKLLLAGTAVLLASVYSVMASGFDFEDYLWFLMFPVAYLAAVVLATIYETRPGRAGRLVLASVCLGSVVAVTSWQAYVNGNPWLASNPEPTNAVAEMIRHYAAPGDKLVVWGWKDGYYVLTGMPPATSQSTYRTIQWKLTNSPRGEYFYNLFLQQFDQARPPVFVEAVGPSWAREFVPEDKWGQDNFPELHERIAAGYVQVGEVADARVYVSKERLCRHQPAGDAAGEGGPVADNPYSVFVAVGLGTSVSGSSETWRPTTGSARDESFCVIYGLR
jgi:hypothetical protein